MRHFYDESGDFNFPEDRYDVYTQAVLIAPDSQLDELDEWVKSKQTEWGVDELHAVKLDDDQIWGDR